MELIRQSRLSVAPVRDEEWKIVLEMADAQMIARSCSPPGRQRRAETPKAFMAAALRELSHDDYSPFKHPERVFAPRL